MIMRILSHQAMFTSMLATMLVAGCASQDPQLITDNAYRSPCPGDMTPLCVEYAGQRLRCYCSTKDGLKEILEPENQ